MSACTIRDMRASDLGEVHGLLVQLERRFESGHPLSAAQTAEIFAAMQSRPDCYVNRVAEAEGRVVGFISAVLYKSFFHAGGTALINELVVDQGRRGRGIGGLLVREVRRLAQALGMNELEVGTSPGNAEAITFYRAQGLSDESLVFGVELRK